MKITRHKDGTYSITGMRSEDMSALAFGASSAAAWYAKASNRPFAADDDREAAWNDRQMRLYDRLDKVLHKAAEAKVAGNMTVVGTDDPGDTFAIGTIRGLEPFYSPPSA